MIADPAATAMPAPVRAVVVPACLSVGSPIGHIIIGLLP